jgi:hypothetical protein
MSTASPSKDASADDDIPNDSVPVAGRTAPAGRRTPRTHALVGGDLGMVLTMAAVVGLLLGVVVLVELLS